jgi:hypothetical protein
VGHKPDVEKARFWRKAVHAAARSGLSIREFCRQRKLHESQLYWWQRHLGAAKPADQTLVTDPTGAAKLHTADRDGNLVAVGEDPSAWKAGPLSGSHLNYATNVRAERRRVKAKPLRGATRP